MVRQRENTVCLSFKVKVPHEMTPRLEELRLATHPVLRRMLQNRDQSSTKHYPEIPSVLAKSLITKYQRNKKLKSVKNLVLPVCGDKGKQVKKVDNGFKIPAFFKKLVIPCSFPRPIVGHIRNVEFFRRKKQWYVSYQYDVACLPTSSPQNVLGIDRNSKGNVAVAACPQTGQVLMLGPDTQGLKQNLRNRRSKLQKKGKFKAIVKIKRKQSNRTKDINHKVSRAIVKHARKTSSVIVLEDLGTVRKGKIKRFVERVQWSFYQLESFLKYKAALSGVPIHYVSPRNTSKMCSRCGVLNTPNGKHYKCSCGNISHRDVNAAFNIAKRFADGRTVLEKGNAVGLIGNPLTGIGAVA